MFWADPFGGWPFLFSWVDFDYGLILFANCKRLIEDILVFINLD